MSRFRARGEDDDAFVDKNLCPYIVDPNVVLRFRDLPNKPQWLVDLISKCETASTAEIFQKKAKQPHSDGKPSSDDVKDVDKIVSCPKTPMLDILNKAKTVPLPESFPKNVGKAKNALAFALSEYDAALLKRHKNDLTYNFRGSKKQVDSAQQIVKSAKQVRDEMQTRVEETTKLHFLHQHSFLRARRASYSVLPGFEPHNPNPLYTIPALLLPSMHFAPIEKKPHSLFRSMFDRPLKLSKVVSAVGRKPSPTDMAIIRRQERQDEHDVSESSHEIGLKFSWIFDVLTFILFAFNFLSFRIEPRSTNRQLHA
jgi:hypothetical protein